MIEIKNASGITDVPGFRASGSACDVRNLGNDRLDTALIYSIEPCNYAGVYTLNDIKAAPVLYCMQLREEQNIVHGIVANSGNANACTGEQGKRDTVAMAKLAEDALAAPRKEFPRCINGADWSFSSDGKIGERHFFSCKRNRLRFEIWNECSRRLS